MGAVMHYCKRVGQSRLNVVLLSVRRSSMEILTKPTSSPGQVVLPKRSPSLKVDNRNSAAKRARRDGGLYGIPPMMDQYDLGLPLCPGPMSLPVFYPEDNSLIKGADAAGDNDWTCPKCGNINFSFQSFCSMKQYNTLKPGSQSAKHEKHTKQKMPDGSWKCEKCNDINYPLKPADSKKPDSPAPDNNDQGAPEKLSFAKASSAAKVEKEVDTISSLEELDALFAQVFHHGTTCSAFSFISGIMLNACSRATSKDEKGEYIRSDEEKKIFQLSGNQNVQIWCTLAGDIFHWHKLFRHLLAQEPTSPRNAFDIAVSYLNTLAADEEVLAQYKKEDGDDLRFGTIVAGHDPQEGFQIFHVFFNGKAQKGKRVVTKEMMKTTSLGSGGSSVLFNLRTKVSRNMSIDAASDLSFNILCRAAIKDKHTGGLMQAVHIHETGFDRQVYKPMRVFSTYFFSDICSNLVKEKTLIMLYSVIGGMIVGDEDYMNKFILEIWPRISSVTNVCTSHCVATKADYFIHFITFKNKSNAVDAYEEKCDEAVPTDFPPELGNLRECLGGFHLVKESQRRLYFGMSSQRLLDRIDNLNDPNHYRYDEY